MNAQKRRLDLEPIEDQIAELSDNVLACRDIRHAWGVDRPFYRVDVEGGRRGVLYAERVVGCLRCGTTRVELWAIFKTHMEKLSNRYTYPQGYHLHGRKRGQSVTGMIVYEQMRRAGGLGE